MGNFGVFVFCYHVLWIVLLGEEGRYKKVLNIPQKSISIQKSVENILVQNRTFWGYIYQHFVLWMLLMG